MRRVDSGRRLSAPEGLAIISLTAAVWSLAFGSMIAAIALVLAAMMGWTRMFEQARSEGKSVLSNFGRLGVTVFMVVIATAFTLDARYKTRSPSPASPSFGITDAADACKDAVLARSSHPSTVEFPTFDYNFHEFDEGRSRLLMSARMRNGFNLVVDFDVQCDFTGRSIGGVILSEARARR